jgi:hypothetical protein
MSTWPDRPAAATHGMTVRDQLDYVAWICEAAEAIGLHPPAEVESWRQRLHRAYGALVDPMVTEHGDPLPPDVPPALRPGTWPDVPAATLPGMTIRHQLTVLRTIAVLSRGHAAVHHNPVDSDRWAARVQVAYEALNHGSTMPMPDSARSASPVPATDGKAKPGSKRSTKKPASPRKKAPAKARAKSKKR